MGHTASCAPISIIWGAAGWPAFDSGFAGKPRTRFFVFKEIYERNGRSCGLVLRLAGMADANFFFSIFRTQSSRQMTQQSELALPNHAFRLFHRDAKETVDFAIVAG